MRRAPGGCEALMLCVLTLSGSLSGQTVDVPATGGVSFIRGNAQYYMNQVRGQVTLRRGDRAGAIEYLRRAGDTEGSPQLMAFGPRTLLAPELL